MSLELDKPDNKNDDVILIEQEFSIVVVDDDCDEPTDTGVELKADLSALKMTTLLNTNLEHANTVSGQSGVEALATSVKSKQPKRDTTNKNNTSDPKLAIAKLQGLEQKRFNAAIDRGASKVAALKAAQTLANKRQRRKQNKLKKLTAKPINKQTNLCFIASDRTCVLTSKQIVELQSAILDAALMNNTPADDLRPQFVGTETRKGWLLLKCVNNNSAEWVRRNIDEVRKHTSVHFTLLEEKDCPKDHTIQGYFSDSAQLSNKSVLSYIEAQNELKTEYWEVKQRTVRDKVLHLTMSIDEVSMLALTKRHGKISYRLDQTYLQLNGQQSYKLPIGSTKPMPKDLVGKSTAVSNVYNSASDKQFQKSVPNSNLWTRRAQRDESSQVSWSSNFERRYRRNNGHQQNERFRQCENFQDEEFYIENDLQQNEGFQQQNRIWQENCFHQNAGFRPDNNFQRNVFDQNFNFGQNVFQADHNFQRGQSSEDFQPGSRNYAQSEAYENMGNHKNNSERVQQIFESTFDVIRRNNFHTEISYQNGYNTQQDYSRRRNQNFL